MDISVVIVNWNAGPALRACLDSLDRAALALEVIVVDNASGDGSTHGLCDRYPRLRLLRNAHNVGFARACNQGLRQASGDLLLWLNPDTTVAPDALPRMAALLAARPDVGLVGPRIVLPDGTLDLDAARNLPSLRGAWAELTYLRRLLPRSHLFGHWRMGWWDHRSSRAVPCLVGACMMMPRTLWERLGPLDETLPMYFEDLDYCARARHAGWQVYYLAEAEIFHHAGLCSRRAADRAQLEVWKWYAQWLYFRRYRSWPAALLFRAMVSALGAARTAALTTAWLILAPFSPSRRAALALARDKAARLTLWAAGLHPVEKELP